ncbi:MAG: S8 family peptidase [Trebonia sp.]
MAASARFLRAVLPCVTALTAVLAVALPANAQSVPSRGTEWWLTALGVPKAWQTAPGQGTGVTVAVLSTGVDATHPDLTGDVAAGPDFSDSGRGAGSQFWGTEGTAVASLIAGHGHGAGGTSGITGIAPHAKVLSVRVTIEYDDPLGRDAAITRKLPDAIADGIRYAVSHGAQVIALPLDPGTFGSPAAGGTATGKAGRAAAAGGSAAEREAVSYALAHNVVLVAPAGDNGASTNAPNYPAAYPGVIAAGATEKDGGLAPFTSTRSYVAVTAPGARLPVAAPDGGYGTLSSSDMSSALTAGVAALIRSQFPRLTAAQAARALEGGTTPVPAPSKPGDGHGEINAADALSAAAAINAALPPARPQPGKTAAGQGHNPGTSQATTQGGDGTVIGSVLRTLVIVVGVLVVMLAVALALLQSRRRRAIAARHAATAAAPAPRGGSHTRRAIEAAVKATAGTGRTAAGRTGEVVLRGTAFSPGGTRAAEAARSAVPARPRIIPMAASGGVRQARRRQERPPWELPSGVGPSPRPADISDRISNSGPMYVWNPATSSGPFPAAPGPAGQAHPSRPHPDREQPPEPQHRRRPPL